MNSGEKSEKGLKQICTKSLRGDWTPKDCTKLPDALIVRTVGPCGLPDAPQSLYDPTDRSFMLLTAPDGTSRLHILSDGALDLAIGRSV